MVSVISYNIMMDQDYFVERHMALVELLVSTPVDVVCLQEVRYDILPILLSTLSKVYTPAIKQLQPQGRPYGEIIFTGKNVSQIAFECIPFNEGKQGRAVQHLKVEKDSTEFNIYTFHLESMNCQKIRRGQMEQLWDIVKNTENAVMCGDTNLTAKETTHKDYYIPTWISDAWEETGQTIGEHTYYSGRFWDGDRRQRYDRVWITKDLYTTAFGILGEKQFEKDVWISDHNGLFINVTPKITFGEKFSKGGFSEIYRGTFKNENVVLKKILTSKIPHTTFFKELIPRTLSHKNIVKVFGGVNYAEKYIIAIESLRGPDLSVTYTQYSYRSLLGIFIPVSDAIRYLHKNGIAHRDIKLKNIVMDGFRPVLIDFGFAVMNGDNKYLSSRVRLCGTPNNIAPEMYTFREPTIEQLQATDVFAFGVTMYMAFNKCPPYIVKKDTPNRELIKIKSNPKPSLSIPGLGKIIDSMLKNVNDRPNITIVHKKLCKLLGVSSCVE